MLIAQITDIHLGFEPDNPAEFNRKRLDRTLNDICELETPPDLLLVTGDLADLGDLESYRRLRGALGACRFPVWPCLGNHDNRANFRTMFPEIPTSEGGFVQYAVDAGELRILVLDTLEEGRHGGSFCETRARWLADRLAEQPGRPTIVVLHHPPIETGIPWMTIQPGEPWTERLAAAIKPHAGNVVAMLAGHIHRPMAAGFAGTTLTVCPSTAPQVALDLREISPVRPDQRDMIVADPPGYALHLWTGRTLVTHVQVADDHTVLARYDSKLQPMVSGLVAERDAVLQDEPKAVAAG